MENLRPQPAAIGSKWKIIAKKKKKLGEERIGDSIMARQDLKRERTGREREDVEL